MIANPKSTTDTSTDPQGSGSAETPQFSLPAAFAALFYKGLESCADLQKSTLDMYIRHADDTVKAWKQAASLTPGTLMADVAVQSADRFLEIQKSVVDLMVRQSVAGVDAVKQRGVSVSKAAGAMAEHLHESAKASVATHKLTLDFAARQNAIAMDAMQQQPGISGTPVSATAEAIRRSVDAAIENQKQLLDLAVKPMETQKTGA